MVTRGQKRRMDEEKKEEEQNYKEKKRFVGEGSGKNNTIKEQEQHKDADTEETLSDWQSAWDEYFEDRRKEIAEKSKKMKEKQVREVREEGDIEEGEDSQNIQDADTMNKPNFIWNESKETAWGKSYFRAHKQGPLFGKEKKIRHPFYANNDGFIFQRHPSQGQNRVYVWDGKLQIGGEHYCIRTLLIHAAHDRLVHYGVTKTYRDLSKDTF